MATINLASKYSTKLDERFSLSSRTNDYVGSDYDFTGVNTINIYSIDGTDLADYDRTATSDRFGTTTEIGDTVQTMVLDKDKGFSRAIDYGNAGEQYNVKRAQTVLKSIWDETMVPAIDKYRIEKWMNGAGMGVVSSTALSKTTVIEAIMNGSAALSNEYVPLPNRVLFVKEGIYIACKLASEIVGIDTLGSDSVKNGKVGYLDGMPVVRMPDSYFPAGINFLIKYKGATVDPITLKTLRVQKAPKGYDADILEGRVIYDSFVLDNKINGIYVHAQNGMAACPTGDSGTTAAGCVTLSCATSGATVKYTTDGTNPKTSQSALTYSTAFTSPASGSVVRAYACKTGLVNSPVFKMTIA
jgi:hypothetical protein